MYKYLFILLLLAACQTESEELSASELQAVDTLYINELEELRPLLDSICAFEKDSLVGLAVDSLMKVRLWEIDQILNRQ